MERINILWVEDQAEDKICDGFKKYMFLKKMNLITFTNWKSAEEYLDHHVADITAVILDCYCLKDENDVENSRFLPHAIKGVEIMTERHKKVLPWYVLSAGSKDDFQTIMELTVTDSRKLWDWDWEKGYYSKFNPDGDFEQLVKSIERSAINDKDYNLRLMYKNVFSFIDECGFLDKGTIKIITDILKPLHYPDLISGFNALLHYNQLRQLLENFYKACHKVGLLPEECIESGKVNLWESYNYLSGNKLKHHELRYGNDGEAVLPGAFSKMISQLLSLSNQMSHSDYVELSEEDSQNIRKFFEEEGTPYTLFGFTLIFCDLFLWFKNRIRKKSYEENRSKINRLTAEPKTIEEWKSKYEDKTFLIEVDSNNNVHAGKCLLKYDMRRFSGKTINIKIIDWNTKDITKADYPIFCKSNDPIA